MEFPYALLCFGNMQNVRIQEKKHLFCLLHTLVLLL